MKTIRSILLTVFSILIPLGLFVALRHGADLPTEKHVVKKTQEELIEAVISKNMKKIVACYNQRLRHGLDKMGDLKVGWDIDEQGFAQNFRQIENQLDDAELYDCSAESISHWVFPKGIYFKVHYDFHLKYENPVKTASREMASDTDSRTEDQ